MDLTPLKFPQLSFSYQDIYCARTAIDLAGGDERQDGFPLPEPGVDLAFQDRTSFAGAQSFTVNDAYTKVTATDTPIDKFGERCFCLGRRQSVEIDLGLHAEAAAGQFAKAAATYGRAPIREVLPACGLHGLDIRFQTFAQYFAFIAFPGSGPGRGATRRRRDGILTQRPGARHQASKEADIIVGRMRWRRLAVIVLVWQGRSP